MTGDPACTAALVRRRLINVCQKMRSLCRRSMTMSPNRSRGAIRGEELECMGRAALAAASEEERDGQL